MGKVLREEQLSDVGVRLEKEACCHQLAWVSMGPYSSSLACPDGSLKRLISKSAGTTSLC